MRVPLIDWRDVRFVPNLDKVVPLEYINASRSLPDGCFALRVRDDAMRDYFYEGDIVIVNPEAWVNPGNIVIGKACIGEVERFVIRSYIPVGYDKDIGEIYELQPMAHRYPKLHSVKNDLSVIGVVVELVRRIKW